MKKEKKSRINILRLRDKSQDFQLKLRNRFECLNVEEAGIDESYKLISETVMEVAAEIAPQGKKMKEDKTEDKVIEQLDRKRKELREIRDKTKIQKVEYAELVKTVRKKRRQRSRRKRKEKIESILRSGRGAQHINKLNRKKTRMHQMKQKDGTITNDRQEILDVCSDFYQELYSSKSNENKPKIVSPDQSALPEITEREVEAATKEMKDKAPGTDDITSDIIKISGRESKQSESSPNFTTKYWMKEEYRLVRRRLK